MGSHKMLPRKVFSVKPGLSPTLRNEVAVPSEGSGSRSTRRAPQVYHDQYCFDNTRRTSPSRASTEDLSIPQPIKASRPINMDELFPDRDKMNTSEVDGRRCLNVENPIIVITEDPTVEYDGDEDTGESEEEMLETIPENKAEESMAENESLEKEKATSTPPEKREKIQPKEEVKKPEVVEDNKKAIKDPINEDDINRELLVKLIGGWFDSEIKKQIKPTPKGWQLIPV